MATDSPHYDSLPSYDEPVPGTVETVKHVFYRNPVEPVKNYIISLFPILQWIHRYNLTWLYGDLIAGISVGMVLVPQGMSYAKIAELEPQYGLYSSFVGVMFYCFFATSKDVSIGPVAVMSLQVSKVIENVIGNHPEYKGQEPIIATTLALLCGSIAFGIGILRLGFILEFIPIPAVMGFMTGSAINIVVGQVPALFGISKLFDTRAAPYEVIINTLKNLGHTKLDAAFGLVPLFLLYLAKWGFNWGSKRWPKYSRVFFFSGVLRNGVMVIFATLISWGVCKGYAKGEYPISILKEVPRGLKEVRVQNWDRGLMRDMAGELPISTVVLLLEHIAISKSFGRINDYKINPNQELIAIGFTNLIGTFFTAYPATGSFSRSALKSKCGVRTPLAGVFTGVVIILALYALTEAFYWIPNATLSAVIIHAVGDLVAHPKTTFRFWKSSPLEAIIFLVAVIMTVFITIEAGIYFAVAASLVWLLLRVAFPSGQFLGRVEYCQVNNPVFSNEKGKDKSDQSVNSVPSEVDEDSKDNTKVTVSQASTGIRLDDKQRRFKWVPMNHKNINPDVKIVPPPPGVVVFRPSESFTYPNCSRQADVLIDEVKRVTRRGIDPGHEVKLGDRPWNDHGPRHRKNDPNNVDTRPVLRAVVFDFSASPHSDLTGVQCLVDIRQTLDKYANRKVEYHFVGILSAWTRRLLISEGFGRDPESPPQHHYVHAVRKRSQPFRGIFEEVIVGEEQQTPEPRNDRDEEESPISAVESKVGFDEDYSSEFVPALGTDTPFFHFDIPDLDEL